MMMSSPEPMSLGSPTQSPTQQQSSNNHTTSYLPQFLLGDLSLNPSLINRQQQQQFQLQQQQQLQHQYQLQQNQQSSGSKYWSIPGGGSNSPPRTSNLILNNPHHHHLMQQQQMQQGGSGLVRTYSLNSYDGGRLSTGSASGGTIGGSGGGGGGYGSVVEKCEPSGGGYGASSAANYSPNNANLSQQGGVLSSQMPASGPPVNRLADTLNTKPQTPLHNHHHLQPIHHSASLDHLSPYTPSTPSFKQQNQLSQQPQPLPPVFLHNSPPSPTQLDPFYTQGESLSSPPHNLDDTWVTVFGFPPSATSYVLQEFAIYGQIVKYITASTGQQQQSNNNEQGNWLHLRYQTRMQAQKAMSKNGKVLGGQFMVGVMQCIDRRVMGIGGGGTAAVSVNSSVVGGGEENAPQQGATNGMMKMAAIGNNRAAGISGSRLDRTQSLRAGVRPLGPFNNRNTVDDSSVDQASTKLPKKNTNVISKAMEFMFGW